MYQPKNASQFSLTNGIKKFFIIISLALTVAQKSSAQQPYNILILAIDDLNDWVGFLDGNQQSITPNMNKLASQSVDFKNAHCAESVCNPSRVSILTGFLPSTSKVYTNQDTMRQFPVLQNCITLPQYLIQKGYKTMRYGKVFHIQDPQSWSQNGYLNGGSWGTLPAVPGFTPNGIPINDVDEYFYWGSIPDSLFKTTPDYLCTKWSAAQLNSTQTKPFLLACGFTRPHDPWQVPKMFFDRFPINSIVLPNIDTNDLQDIDTGMTPGVEYVAVKKYGLQKEVVQSYLAAVSYADSCVGLVLDALNKSAYANNTIVVLFGDNGFHLGEKLWYDKKTLWEESTRVPLLIKVPGMAPSIVKTPVSLCDIYPTLLDLCNLPANTNNEGESLKPLILNPLLSNTRVALTSSINTEVYSISGQTVRSKNWRYSVHESGALELYNHTTDPMEFTNLASNNTYDSTRNFMATQLNKVLFKRNSTRLAVRTNYIPGIIQAEKYDMGGEGIAYHDEDTINFGGYYRMKDGVDIAPCLDSAGGLQIDSIKYGEWLTYTIKQIDSGGYNLNFRVLSNSTAARTIKVFVNNVLAVQTPIPNTINVWQTISTPVFNLQKKTNAKLKVTFNGKDFKLNSFEFVKKSSIAQSEERVYLTKNFLYIKPNPVSEESQIYFTMAEDGIANLYITNTSGEKVCTILNEYMAKGIKEVNFIPSQYNLPAGIYFCTIKAHNQQDCSKKIIISK